VLVGESPAEVNIRHRRPTDQAGRRVRHTSWRRFPTRPRVGVVATARYAPWPPTASPREPQDGVRPTRSGVCSAHSRHRGRTGSPRRASLNPHRRGDHSDRTGQAIRIDRLVLCGVSRSSIGNQPSCDGMTDAHLNASRSSTESLPWHSSSQYCATLVAAVVPPHGIKHVVGTHVGEHRHPVREVEQCHDAGDIPYLLHREPRLAESVEVRLVDRTG